MPSLIFRIIGTKKMQIRDCKWCGAEPVYERAEYAHLIYCGKCDYETAVYNFSTDAVAEWNKKRLISDKKPVRIDK